LVWWDRASWWVATPSVHHGFQHNDLSVEILSFIFVERVLMILSKFDSEDAIRKAGWYVEVVNTYMAVYNLFILGSFGRVKWSLFVETFYHALACQSTIVWVFGEGVSSRERIKFSAFCVLLLFWEWKWEAFGWDRHILFSQTVGPDFVSSFCCNCYERTERRVL
jgi:hypothetical protein